MLLMGPQPEAEGNLPQDGDEGEDEVPHIPIGAVVGFQEDAGSSDDADDDAADAGRGGGYQLLNAGVEAEVREVYDSLDGWGVVLLETKRNVKNTK